jgi:Rhodopirellula transposase DDE domain
MALAQDAGRGAQSHGLAGAQRGQSHTAQAEQRDGRHVRHHGTKDQEAATADTIKRVSIDGKATVHIGAVSRGGLTRGDPKACDHDLGWQEQDMPCGIVDADNGQWRMPCGRSSKTSDCIVDALEAWWSAWDATEQVILTRLQITMENGPESSGRRTQCFQRMVGCCDAIGKPMQRLSSPPSQSKYHPIERCWGILEVHWNGTTWVAVETMVEWAKSMTWQGMHPIVELSRKVDQKAVTLSTKAMREVEARLERHPELPKWDILIHPASP